MYCQKCKGLEGRELKVSIPKRERERCEHCGFPIDEKGQRLNKAGMPTDGKGEPKPIRRAYIPRPSRWKAA